MQKTETPTEFDFTSPSPHVAIPVKGLNTEAPTAQPTAQPASVPEKEGTIQTPNYWNHLHSRSALPGFHPTHSHFHHPHIGLHAQWQSRRHRKGRNPKVVIDPAQKGNLKSEQFQKPWYRYRYWGWDFGNISWWVSQLFVWGSVAWVINACLLFHPTVVTTFYSDLAAWWAFIGGTLFEFGALAMYFESLNQGQSARFGEEVEKLVGKKHSPPTSRQKSVAVQTPHQQDQQQQDQHDTPPPLTADSQATISNVDPVEKEQTKYKHLGHDSSKPWVWFGFPWQDIGFTGSFIQVLAATIFWISTITGLPNVLPPIETHVHLWNGIYWTPQVVGGCGFIIASLLFMFETQDRWYKIKPLSLGWQVGVWNLVGAVGFTLCGIFGYWYTENEYQFFGTTLSTYWGSYAFLLGSYIQLVEALNP